MNKVLATETAWLADRLLFYDTWEKKGESNKYNKY